MAHLLSDISTRLPDVRGAREHAFHIGVIYWSQTFPMAIPDRYFLRKVRVLVPAKAQRDHLSRVRVNGSSLTPFSTDDSDQDRCGGT
jgi:hypothetical protein